MPCRTYDDDELSTRRIPLATTLTVEKQKVAETAEVSLEAAALCAILTYSGNKIEDLLDALDYAEAGITKGQLKAWWLRHQADDILRKEKEQMESVAQATRIIQRQRDARGR